MTTPLIEAVDVRKTYRLGRVPVPVLHGVSLRVEEGEWVAVLGSSGSGKSTLLHILGGLDRPDPGTGSGGGVRFRGEPLAAHAPRRLDEHRARDVGFVFQFYHLLPELSVLENVAVASMVAHGRFGYVKKRAQLLARARELLETVGLSHRLRHRSAELSGGERQRVAIARALMNDPALLLADEPTGNLDRKTGAQILDAIEELREGAGEGQRTTIVMVTHDESIAARADRALHLVDGRIEESVRPSSYATSDGEAAAP